jgi:hypothetical protein
MKAYLLFPDRDFDPKAPLPWNDAALVQDLELTTLFGAMAQQDEVVFEVAERVILTGLPEGIETIRYRQSILEDCLANPGVIRELYALSVEAVEAEKKHYLGTLARHPDWVLRWATGLIEALLGSMRRLRRLADAHAEAFRAEGWREFFSMLKRELDDEYLASVERHLKQLRFRGGMLLSAELGKGNKGRRYILHQPPSSKPRWLDRIFTHQPPVYVFQLHPRDESGARMLSELQNRGISLVASALGQSADHVRSFFAVLRRELAFYVGCINLHERLARKGEPICMPVPASMEESRLSFRGIYDICLSLSMEERVVGNDGNADGKDMVVITGANTGGKSTLLRSIGLAQLMMQCGMFVPAEAFSANLCSGLFTHYKREEDTAMKSGKLDEELGRMSQIVDYVKPRALILFNESFAATNEREGSEIARQIVSALLEKRIKIGFVTHLYEFAHGLYRSRRDRTLFLRADRLPDGARTFKLKEGEPRETSFGEDLYNSVFGGGGDEREADRAKARVETS